MIRNTNDGGTPFAGRIVPGSPADRSRQLNIDDRILEINGVSISDLPHSDVVGLVKSSGTSVKLKIARPGLKFLL